MVEFSSGVTEARLFRLARTFFTLLRFGGEAFFEGEGASEGALLSARLKMWEGWTDGSTASLALVFRVRTDFGIFGASVVLLREALLIRVGAGVNSSPLSSSVCLVVWLSSSSSESTTALRLFAARREGLVGDSADMLRCQAAGSALWWSLPKVVEINVVSCKHRRLYCPTSDALHVTKVR